MTVAKTLANIFTEILVMKKRPPKQLVRPFEGNVVTAVQPVITPARPRPAKKRVFYHKLCYGYERQPYSIDEIYDAADRGELIFIDDFPRIPWKPHEIALWRRNEGNKVERMD